MTPRAVDRITAPRILHARMYTNVYSSRQWATLQLVGLRDQLPPRCLASNFSIEDAFRVRKSECPLVELAYYFAQHRAYHCTGGDE